MTILITGGSSGIGRAIAKACAKLGHNLVLVARNRTRLRKTRDLLRRDFGVRVETVSADISVPRQVEKIRQYCRRHACLMY